MLKTRQISLPYVVGTYFLIIICLVQSYIIISTSISQNLSARVSLFANSTNSSQVVSQRRVICGIFSVAHLEEQRNIIRNTWMKYDGVCTRLNQTNCSIVPYFVIGRITSGHSAAIARENGTHGDIIALDIEENMNGGKTFEWFLYVSLHFKNEAFIGKTDMDSFIRADRLHRDLHKYPENFVYAGRLVDFVSCGMSGGCPRGWAYMSGSFYILSIDLVHLIADPGNEYVRSHRSGTEDLTVGEWLFAAEIPLNLYVWDHLQHELASSPFIHPVKTTSLFYSIYQETLDKS